MTVDSITSSTSSTSATSTPQNQLQGTQDEFLKMFMAQLQNQDPMNPSSQSDMVAQLATFTQVEQATTTNSDLSAMAAQETSSASAGMANLVGRTVDATTGNFTVTATGGAPPALEFSSTGTMSGATASITDANGNVVRTLSIPNGSSTSVQWDGKDANGVAVPPGSYTMTVNAGKSTGTITSQWQGAIDSVAMTASGARLQMGDIQVAPADITTIGSAAASSAALSQVISQSAAITAISKSGAAS